MNLKHYTRALIISILLTVSGVSFAELVNINKADAAALMENLPGIGEVKAKAIVSYRKKNGNFKRVEDLLNVPGIGQATFKNLKSEVSTSRGATKATGKKPITSTKQLSASKGASVSDKSVKSSKIESKTTSAKTTSAKTNQNKDSKTVTKAKQTEKTAKSVLSNAKSSKSKDTKKSTSKAKKTTSSDKKTKSSKDKKATKKKTDK
ncbi:MAG: helix-hairpin-helix domain-containing protein [Pseudomonadota bacterium]